MTLPLTHNVLILGHLRQGSVEGTTANRLKQTCNHDNSTQTWGSFNLLGTNQYERLQFNLTSYLLKNQCQCFFALKPSKLIGDLKGCGVPYCVVMYDSELQLIDRQSQEGEGLKACLEEARFVVLTSEILMNKMQRVWPQVKRDKLRLIKRGVTVWSETNDSVFSQLDFHPSTTPYFLVVSRIEASKDPLHLIPAFTHWHQLHQKHPLLVLVGSKADEDYFEKLVNTIKSCPGVVWLGALTQRHVHELMRGAVGVVACAPDGGGCSCIMEAQNLGTPVIARINPVHCSYIDAGNNGLLYTKPEDFLERATQLLSDGGLRERLVEGMGKVVADGEKEAEKYKELASIVIGEMMDKDGGSGGMG